MKGRIRRGDVSIEAVKNFELWLLAHGDGPVSITVDELDRMPVRAVEHLVGFTVGAREKEKEDLERQQRQAKMRNR